jgi:hypothetical protein
MRSQAGRSDAKTDLNETELNSSISEDDAPLQPAEKKVGKSVIGNQMSKILAEIDDDDHS